ncbi:MAG: hypothetical protein OXU20_34655 [Myxococcales bacterium]|nr:hypothetical protein [Myxococcales bacterium]MDD9964892.1 hypothetical protein [Myxococcales bacterium]
MDARTRLLMLRGLLWGLLIAWGWKWNYLLPAYNIYDLRPLDVPFFPAWLECAEVYGILYVAPVLVSLVGFLRNRPGAYGAALGAFAVCASLMLLHQGTYNDATYVTAFWVALIGLWAYRASAHPAHDFRQRLGFLSQLLIGLLFLGGIVGKLTPGYFDGTVLYEIYFKERQYFTFRLVRALVEPEQLATAAKLYSWMVLAVEASLASLPMWPTRPALVVAIFALGGLVVFNNTSLASVVVSVMGLAAVSLWLERVPAESTDVHAPARIHRQGT